MRGFIKAAGLESAPGLFVFARVPPTPSPSCNGLCRARHRFRLARSCVGAYVLRQVAVIAVHSVFKPHTVLHEPQHSGGASAWTSLANDHTRYRDADRIRATQA